MNKVPIWHSRLGHMSHKNMMILVRDGIFKKKDVGTFSVNTVSWGQKGKFWNWKT